jgi:hypothetical protein
MEMAGCTRAMLYSRTMDFDGTTGSGSGLLERLDVRRDLLVEGHVGRHRLVIEGWINHRNLFLVRLALLDSMTMDDGSGN